VVLHTKEYNVLVSDFLGAYFSGLYLTKSLQTPGGGDILMALLGPLTLTYALTLFRQRSVSTHTLGPGAKLSVLQMMIFVSARGVLNAYAEFYPLPLIQRYALLQVLRHHATEFGAVVPVAAIFSSLVTILAGRQLGLHEFLTRSVAARSTTLAFAIPVTTAIGGSISNS
jgi:putative effector of murein hydrolase